MVYQPYNSSGRIPTVDGLKLYIENYLQKMENITTWVTGSKTRCKEAGYIIPVKLGITRGSSTKIILKEKEF